MIALVLSVCGAGAVFAQVDGLPSDLGAALEGIEEARLAVTEGAEDSVSELYRLYNDSIVDPIEFETVRERVAERLDTLEQAVADDASTLRERRSRLAGQILALGDELSSRERAFLWNWLSIRFVTAGSHSEAFFALVLEAFPALTGFESDESARRFYATAFGRGNSPESAPDEALELWLLYAASLPFAERLNSQEALVDALRARGEFNVLVSDLERLVVDARVERRVRLDESSPDLASPTALAAAHPAAFASTDDYFSGELDTAAIRRSLRLASSRDEAFVLRLAESSFAFRFFLERMESLLRLASPSERAAFARAIAFDYGELQRVSPRLSYALSRPHVGVALDWPQERTSGGASGRPAEYSDDELVHFFDLYREQGAGFAADLSRRVEDDSSSSEPEYRWAMLSVMNHPYALYSLRYPEAASQHASSSDALSRAEAARAREALQAFTDELYARTLGALGNDERFLVAVPGGDGYLITDRLYRSGNEETAARLYRAFVAAAQELDPLPENFLETYTAGIDRASHWSHQHGLDVAVSQTPASRAPDGFVEPWFTLHEAADIPDEGFSHAIRGAAALVRAARSSLDTVVAASGEPGIATLAPRTAALVEIALEMIAFRVMPDEGVRRMKALLPPAAAGESMGARVEGVIASETQRAVFKLEQAGRGERVVFDQLRGTTGEEE